MDADSLRVDIADVNDVRAQLPRARAILERKRRAVEAQIRDYDSFRELVNFLAKRAGVELADLEVPQPVSDRKEPSQRGDVLGLVVEFVNREVRPIRARDVQAALRREGHELVGDSVRDALYYAANRRDPPLIRSLPERGFYAPLTYKDAVIFDSANGTGSSSSSVEGRTAPET